MTPGAAGATRLVRKARRARRGSVGGAKTFGHVKPSWRGLSQKVGGGYVFVHRLLLEHFAESAPSPRAAAIASSPPAHDG
jgi:hypothetical protein